MDIAPDEIPALRESAFWRIVVPAADRVSRLAGSGRRAELDAAAGRLRGACLMLERIGWPGDPVTALDLGPADAEMLREAARVNMGAYRPPPAHGPVPPPTGTPSDRRTSDTLGRSEPPKG